MKFLSLIKEDDYVLDIGANVGSMSVMMAKKAKKGQVYSYEPIPNNFETLKRVVHFHKLKNISCSNYALGDENTEISMVLPIRENIKKHGFSHVVSSDRQEKEGVIYKVPQKRLDDIPELQAIKINAIKIDVENHEYYVLKGAVELLKKNRPLILCEVWTNELRDKVLQLMSGIDYRTLVLDGDDYIEYNPKLHYNERFTDFVFAPLELSEYKVSGKETTKKKATAT